MYEEREAVARERFKLGLNLRDSESIHKLCKKRLINFFDIDFGIRMANYFAYGVDKQRIYFLAMYISVNKIKEGVFPSFAIFKKKEHNFK